MSIMLPDALVTLLHQLNIKWPEGDEGKTFEYAKKWAQMGDQVRAARDAGEVGQRKALDTNEGASADAFLASITAPDGPLSTASSTSVGLQIGAAALVVAAAAILVLKVVAIVQLVQLLIKEIQAYAAAPATFGASLAMIPTWRALAKIAIETVMGRTLGTLKGQS